MKKTKMDSGSGTRQIHLRVPIDIHRRLKVQAVMRDLSISQMVEGKVVKLLEDDLDTKGSNY